MWRWRCFSLNAFMALHLPRQNFICQYLGWSFSLKIFLRTSPSALVFPTNNFVFVFRKFLTSLLTSSWISLLWLPSPAHISAFSLFSPLQRLTISSRFLHLDPSFYTFVVCSLHHPEKPYSFFCTLYLYHMVEIMSNIVVPNLQCVKGDCPCCKGEREDRMLLPGKRSSI